MDDHLWAAGSGNLWNTGLNPAGGGGGVLAEGHAQAAEVITEAERRPAEINSRTAAEAGRPPPLTITFFSG